MALPAFNSDFGEGAVGDTAKTDLCKLSRHLLKIAAHSCRQRNKVWEPRPWRSCPATGAAPRRRPPPPGPCGGRSETSHSRGGTGATGGPASPRGGGSGVTHKKDRETPHLHPSPSFGERRLAVALRVLSPLHGRQSERGGWWRAAGPPAGWGRGERPLSFSCRLLTLPAPSPPPPPPPHGAPPPGSSPALSDRKNLKDPLDVKQRRAPPRAAGCPGGAAPPSPPPRSGGGGSVPPGRGAPRPPARRRQAPGGSRPGAYHE